MSFRQALIFLTVSLLPAALAAASPDSSATVDSLRLILTDDGITLIWAPPTPDSATAGLSKVPFDSTAKDSRWQYSIYFGAHPDNLTRIATTHRPLFHHQTTLTNPTGFYRVTATRSRALRRTNPGPGRDDFVLLDFDEGDIELEPFSEAEDIDANAWELTGEEAFPDSGRSLRLYGNTWKRLSVDPVALTDSTIWQLAILSLDGDTLGDLQAFGLGDGEEQLFYAFHGRRVVWEQPWNIANQDVNPRGDWELFQLAVGYDWNIRYEYLPEITEFYFINDNDNNDPPSQIYFDELIDVTESTPRPPKVRLTWSVYNDGLQPQVIGMGAAVLFRALVTGREPDELDYYWDFGDDAFSRLTTPTHHYIGDGSYSIALTVGSPDGGMGYARSFLEIGEYRGERTLSACFTGDVMLARRYIQPGGIITERGPEAVFERVSDRLNEADITFINLECPLTDEGTPHPTKSIIFRSQPENVAGLTSAGVDVVCLANNHIHDYGRRGLEETLEVLDSAGIAHSGAGLNEYQALQPTFRTVRGVRIGMLAYCNRTGRDYSERPFGDASFDKFGFAYFSADNLLRSVPDAADLCDLLVIYVHGGWEYAQIPSRRDEVENMPANPEEWPVVSVERDSATRELEHLAIDLGADLVIGTHPHVLQGFEIYNGVVIAHSLGNFAFDQDFFETWPSATVWADIVDGRIEEVWIEPIFIDNYLPTSASGDLGRKILDRLAGYSTPLGTPLVLDNESAAGGLAHVALDPDRINREEQEFTVTGGLRYIESEQLYRSEPLRLDGGGYPASIISVTAGGEDLQCSVSLGREILLVGNMEDEGAAIWNYNTDWERADDQVVHNGSRSSYLERPQGWLDIITDLTQRIPVDYLNDRLTLSGWLRTENARDAGLEARYYRWRYNNDPPNIFGDQVVERRLQGDNDWTYLWDELDIPDTTGFVNVRWQLFGPEEGTGRLWADDVELVRWEQFAPYEGGREIPYPSDLFYLQVETLTETDDITVTYRTVTLEY
jgi:poly-gamma-glutamate capsule biosynthesis protein CapA/YwtB (metallophosphatase superfamily)